MLLAKIAAAFFGVVLVFMVVMAMLRAAPQSEEQSIRQFGVTLKAMGYSAEPQPATSTQEWNARDLARGWRIPIIRDSKAR